MRKPTEMEMRVAAFIRAEAEDMWNDLAGKDWMPVARAAIRAMREPPGDVIEAGYEGAATCSMTLLWQSMIDAASPPNGEQD